MKYKEKFEKSEITVRALAKRIHGLCAEKEQAIAKIQARIEELEQKLIPFLDKHSITEMKQYDRLDDLIEENENFLKLFGEE